MSLARYTVVVRSVMLALSFGAAASADDAGAGARALYQEGARLYNLGQYEEAVRAFEEAYSISGARPLLFNIAQAHRLAGSSHCERALRAYESYLREDAEAENRDEVEDRILDMRGCVERNREAELAARRALEARSQPGPGPAPAEPTLTARRGPAVVAIAGGGLLLVGAGLYTAARIKFEHERGNCPCPDGSFATWQSLSTASYVLMATGGAAAAAGISWWIVTRPNAVSYGVTAGPSGVHVTGSF